MHFEITDLMVTVLPPHALGASEKDCPQHTTHPEEDYEKECPSQTLSRTTDCEDEPGKIEEGECPSLTLSRTTDCASASAVADMGASTAAEARLASHREALRQRLAEITPPGSRAGELPS